MIKRAMRYAIGPAIGTTIANIAWKITHPHLYNETWLSILIQAAYHLLVGYAVCFGVILLVIWVGSKVKNET